MLQISKRGMRALAVESAPPSSVICLTGIGSRRTPTSVDATRLNKMLVLENKVIFGSVNANRRHFQLAVAALAAADRSGLERLVSRRVPLTEWRDAFERREHDIKVVIDPRDKTS